MEAELFKELEDMDRAAVCELVNECNLADHTNYDSDLDGDFYYIVRNDDKEESGLDSELFAVLSGYFLGETVEGKKVIEVEAFTHPSMRGIGFFSMCYNSLRDDFRDVKIKFMIKKPLTGSDCAAYERICFESDDESEPDGYFPESDLHGGSDTDDFLCKGDFHDESGDQTFRLKAPVPFVAPDTYETLRSIGAVHLYDELLMEKVLEHPISDPGDDLCNKYGEVHLTGYDKETLYLYGLLVYDKYLGKGHGKALMKAVENYEKPGKYKKILLQVSSNNVIALNLYEGLGYVETERIVYMMV
ncbi:Acetyltransferase (GNAT) family protein [Oribacterium sp. KHPX15]|uniref:GNAT family N-acetyltransferase n=1 Tax=Oribacterium sp. KHPX15 TaxID=1855342 RepID=UPI0008995B0E|nr:GNAT family N-acetyltransferase [Oribacterium sp. KHPX15]SDZ82596.1 Acetyltransferase (GNAT) family protein [Oribacterium sp. KHPX15]